MVVGGGESPGITNVMCALVAEGLESVDSVKVYAGSKETSSNTGLVFPFSVSTVIDEYTRKPVEFLNGGYVEVPPLSGDEEVRFTEPVGKSVCHYSIPLRTGDASRFNREGSKERGIPTGHLGKNGEGAVTFD